VDATVQAGVELALAETAVALPSSTQTPAPTTDSTTGEDGAGTAPSPTSTQEPAQTPTPAPVVSERPTASPTAVPTPSPMAPSPTPFPKATPTRTPRPSPTATRVPTPSPTSIPLPTPTPAPSSAAEITELVRPAILKIETPDGSGSAVAIDSSGTLLTNYHLVAGGSITVVFEDGSQVAADIVGFDQIRDLAVLTIDRATPNYLPVISANTARVGTGVLAIGYPLDGGGELTSTAGTVSAIGVFENTGADYIQTDAAANPGTSGGALVDLYGRFLGIVTSRVEAAGGRSLQDIGFALGVGAHASRIDLLTNGLVFAVPTATPIPSQSYGSFTQGFSVDIPLDWSVRAGGPNKWLGFDYVHRNFISEDWLFWAGTSATAQGLISLRLESEGTSRWTSQSYMDNMVAFLTRSHVSFAQTDATEIELTNGQSAVRFEYAVDYYTDVVYSVGGKRVWKST
jgi:S1-C subfamily serine protease